MAKYDVVESKKVYDGKIIDIYVDRVELEEGKLAYREYVNHGGASCIIPIDENGNIILIRQYRHPAREEVLEIPAGTLDKGEDPQECALRELEEETGYKAGSITFLTKFYTAIGFCNEILYLYLAKDLTPGTQNFDADEFVTIEKYTLDQALEKVLSGEIKDSKTLVAIMLYNEITNRDTKKI